MSLLSKMALAASMTLAVFAEEQAKPQPQPAPAMDPNPMARWGTSDEGNFFITGEVLWIKPLTEELRSEYNNGATQTESRKFFRNEFTTGERVSLGYNTTYDGWDAVLIYTGFNYKHNNSGLDQTANLPSKTSYSYYYNQGDLDFGRMMKVSRKLKMRPHVGVRALWLTEKGKYQADTSGSYQTYSTNRIKNTLYGLEAGLDSVWMFAKTFGVYANLGFGTMVNQQKFVHLGFSTEYNTSSQSYTNYGTKIVNQIDFSIGIRWDKNFSDDAYHFGINLGYEQHSLINLQSPGLGDRVASGYFGNNYNGGFQDPDFTWQGIALGGRFDF